MKKIAAVILAAGEGKRMCSATPKVCQRLLGQPMIFYPVDLCNRLKTSPIVVVVSGDAKRAAAVRAALGDAPVKFAVQQRQLGTGHAVLSALPALKGFSGTVLILYGDVPLLKPQTVRQFLKEHDAMKATVSLMTMALSEPRGYGRIMRGRDGKLQRIIEERDATQEERRIREVNVGLYAVDADFLGRGLKGLKSENAQHEYYLTDLPHLAVKEGLPVHLFPHADADELLGANSMEELARLEEIGWRRKAKELMEQGVRIVDPLHTYIEESVEIAADAVIYPGCSLHGTTRIAAGAHVGPYAVLKNSQIGANAVVKAFCVLDDVKLGKGAAVGPFAHLRPGSELLEDAKVGNFVEMKKARMGRNAKASHLSYLGDAEIGDDANIGAGTITCNYDGYDKHKTVIGAGAFIGSDTQLVAPVKVGKNAIVGAGTTVTVDVPADALALSRTEQTHKKQWAKRWHAAHAKKKRK